MKLRISDRILVALAGLVLVGTCGALVAQVFFQKDVFGKIGAFLSQGSVGTKLLVILFTLLLLALGVYCVMLLLRHRAGKDGFVSQKTESGELSISLDALSTMVNKCLDQHEELLTRTVQLETKRDGLLVIIRGRLAGGISIPLTVDTIQKQIKQYVTACSGVEVREIQVLIESSGEDATGAMFAIEAPTAMPLLRGTEQEGTPELPAEDLSLDPELAELLAERRETVEPRQEETPRPAKAPDPAIAAAAILKSEAPEEEEDDRPIHQRLFATQEEPCVMPMPPEPSEDVEEHG